MNREKRRKREKRIRKRRNIRRNVPKVKYYLELDDGNGGWRKTIEFKTNQEMEAHCQETETFREQGRTIVPGRIINREGEPVRWIEGQKSLEKETMENPLQPGFQGLKGQKARDAVKWSGKGPLM